MTYIREHEICRDHGILPGDAVPGNLGIVIPVSLDSNGIIQRVVDQPQSHC